MNEEREAGKVMESCIVKSEMGLEVLGVSDRSQAQRDRHRMASPMAMSKNAAVTALRVGWCSPGSGAVRRGRARDRM